MAPPRVKLSARRSGEREAKVPYDGSCDRKSLEKMLSGMIETRRPYEPEVYEISGLAMPNRSRHMTALSSKPGSSKKRANRLYDGHAIRSFRTLTAGMYSGMSSPNRPWFKYGLEDKDFAAFQPVKVWLEAAGATVARTLSRSNFYSAVKVGYSEIGVFGTDACIMGEAIDRQTGLAFPVCHPLTFGEYWIGLNHRLEPDRLARQQDMTVWQIVREFVHDSLTGDMDWSRVSPAVRALWDNAKYEETVPIMHMIKPNDEFSEDPRGLRERFAWQSVKWERGSDRGDQVLEERGFYSQPFWAPRWEVAAGDVYGFGPGHDALADMRSLQLQAKRKGEATDYAVKPPLMAPASVRIKWQPGSVTHTTSVDQAQVKPVFEVDYRTIEVLSRDVEAMKDAIDDATYARLFMAITNMEGSADRTIMEIAKREEEKLTQLGPVIERVNTEKLAVALDRVFDICARNDMLPPPPEELEEGIPLDTDFISILAQAQRMIGMQQTERALGFVQQIEGAFPGSGAGDNIDTDALVLDYWDRAGAPAIGIRDERARDGMRQQRAQQEQAARMAQMAPAMAQGADAVKTLAETPVAGGDRTLFDSLIQQPPL